MEKKSDRGFVSGFIGVGIHMTIQHILQHILIAKRCKNELADLKEVVMSVELTIMHIQQNRMAFKTNEADETASDVNRWLNELDGLLLEASKMVQRCSIPKSHFNLCGRRTTKKISSLNKDITGQLKSSPLLVRIQEDQVEDTQKDKRFNLCGRRTTKKISFLNKDITGQLKSSSLLVRIQEDQVEDTQKDKVEDTQKDKVRNTQEVLEGLGKIKDSLEPLASSATTSQAARKELIVGQNEAFESLQKLVMENVEAIGVLGTCGSGKTLYLSTLFNSQEVRDHFRDGLLLWLTVPSITTLPDDIWEQMANDLCKQIATKKKIDLTKDIKGKVKIWLYEQLKQSRFALFLDNVCEWNATDLLEKLLKAWDIMGAVSVSSGSKVIVSSRDRTALSTMGVSDDYTIAVEDFWSFRRKKKLIEEPEMVGQEVAFTKLESPLQIDDAKVGQETALKNLEDFVIEDAKVEPEMVGQETALKNLEDFVIEDAEVNINIGVAGKRGAGKSLLLKKVFNGQKVRNKYSNGFLLWLSLSQNPSVTSLVDDLCKQIAVQKKIKLNQAMKEEEKKKWLKEQLQQSSRFALFLDDVLFLDGVWGRDARRLFEELGIVGAVGGHMTKSKVIVRSRDLSALSEMGVRVAEKYTITIQDLNQEDSWKLFKHHAFPYHDGNLPSNIDEQKAKLVCIQCAGLPLAIKAVAGAMVSSTHPQQWEWALHRLQNAQADRLDDFLRLSFDALGNDDVNMQLCFQHVAAAFPEDEIIDAQEVIPFWMGEGLLARKMLEHVPQHILADRCLIEPMIRNTEERPVCLRMHDQFELGKLYLHLLAERCLIEPVVRDTDGRMHCFRMLKVVRDLAILIAKNEENFYSCVGNRGLVHLPNNEPSKIKRIFLSRNKLESLKQFSSYKEMRSLLISQDCTRLTKIPKQVIGNMRSLKVLDLSGTSARSLPENVGCLTELICLKLSGTQIKELPKSVTGLGHLEILDVSFSKIKELPSDIHMLRSLRYLGLRECKNLQNLPCSISGLLSLQYLYMDGCSMWRKPSKTRCKNVIDGCRKVASLQSLGDLVQLKQLALHTNEEQLEHLDEANRKRLQQLAGEQLEQLALLKSMTEMDTLLLVLPGMVSLPLHINNMSKLRSLSLRCRSLTTMKIGMKDDVCTLQNLKYLKFYECLELKEFQNLHKLQNLRHLEIILCPEVQEIPKEFGEKGAFPSLKIFSLVGLHNLKTLPETEIGALPSLEIFTIMDCPILRTLPESYINLGIRISVYGCEVRGNMDMMQVIPGSINAEVVIKEYLQARRSRYKRREDWLFGESWCNELFLFVAGYIW